MRNALRVAVMLACCLVLGGWDRAQTLRAVEDAQESLLEGDRALAAAALGELGAMMPSERLIKLLRRAIKDRAGIVVVRGLESAVAVGAFELEQEMLGALDHPDAEARVAAVRALVRMGLAGEGSDGGEVLVRRLADGSAVVRREAARAVGELGVRGGVPALVGALADGDAEVALAAVEALTPWAGEPSVLPALLERAREGSWDLRAAATTALGRSGDPRATATLLRLVRDEQPDMRRVALSALAVGRDPAAVEPLMMFLRPDARDSTFVGQVVFALGQIGDVRAVEALLDWSTRRPAGQTGATWQPVALSALSAMGEAAVDPVVRRLLVTADDNTQRDLIALLGRLRSEKAQTWLAQALAEGRYPLPWLVEALISQAQPSGALRALTPPPTAVFDALALRADDLSDEALVALIEVYRGWLGGRWFGLLSARAASGGDALRVAVMRWLATQRAGEFSDAETGAFVLAALQADAPQALRRAAIEAAATLRLDAAVEPLTALALSESAGSDPNEHRAAVSALARIASPEAAAALATLADDADRPLAALAMTALSEALRGADVGEPQAAWRAAKEAALEVALNALDEHATSASGDAALFVLARLKTPELVERWPAWWSEALPNQRIALLRALEVDATSAARTDTLTNTLASALTDALAATDPRLRAEAAWFCGLTQDGARWMAPLTAALFDPAPAVRINAAAALGQLGPDPAAALALRRLLWSEDWMLQTNAIGALARTSEGFGVGLSPQRLALLQSRAKHPFAQETLLRALLDSHSPHHDPIQADAALARLTDPVVRQAIQAQPPSAPQEHAHLLLELWPAPQSPLAHIDAPVFLYLPDGRVRATFSNAHGWVIADAPSPGHIRAAIGLAVARPPAP